MDVDPELVARARSGDEEARGALAELCHERVHRYVLTMIGDDATARDLSQEVFRRALEGLAELREDARFASWLFAIAVNLCRAELRRAWNRSRVDSPEAVAQEPAPGRNSVLSSIVRRESVVALALAIDRLPVLLREAFVLHHVEGLGYEEMAEITGARANALQVRNHRARALLRQQLGAVVDTMWVRE